jgi:hypothetical protein
MKLAGRRAGLESLAPISTNGHFSPESAVLNFVVLTAFAFVPVDRLNAATGFQRFPFRRIVT